MTGHLDMIRAAKHEADAANGDPSLPIGTLHPGQTLASTQVILLARILAALEKLLEVQAPPEEQPVPVAEMPAVAMPRKKRGRPRKVRT